MSELEATPKAERLSRGKLNKLGKGVLMYGAAYQRRVKAEKFEEETKALLLEFIPEIVGSSVPMTGIYKRAAVPVEKGKDKAPEWQTVRLTTTAEDKDHVLKPDYWMVCGLSQDKTCLIVASQAQQDLWRYYVELESIQLVDRETIKQAKQDQ
jgi:hypothetical protein